MRMQDAERHAKAAAEEAAATREAEAARAAEEAAATERRKRRHAERLADSLEQALTSHERQVAAHALRLAAERFDEDAKLMSEAPAHTALVAQFKRQAEDSRALLQRMED